VRTGVKYSIPLHFKSHSRQLIFATIFGSFALLGCAGSASDSNATSTIVSIDASVANDPLMDMQIFEDGGPRVGQNRGDAQPHDMGASQDAEVLRDGTASPYGERLPTWWECRIYLMRDVLDPETAELCDRLHSSAPRDRVYGIRWVFVDHVPDVQTWIDEQLFVLNTVFEGIGFQFVTRSILILDDPIV
jgi:hypothetical protein